MKEIVILYSIIMLVVSSLGQEIWIPFDQTGKEIPEIINLNSTNQKVDFQIIIHGMFVKDTLISYVSYKRINIPDGIVTGACGSPALPSFNKLVAIPTCDSIIVTYEILDSLVLSNYKIYPVPKYQYDTAGGNLSINEIFYIDTSIYSQNVFLPEKSFDSNKKGALREQPRTTYNSEYPAALRYAKIGSRWSPTSGTRRPLAPIIKTCNHMDYKRFVKKQDEKFVRGFERINNNRKQWI